MDLEELRLLHSRRHSRSTLRRFLRLLLVRILRHTNPRRCRSTGLRLRSTRHRSRGSRCSHHRTGT